MRFSWHDGAETVEGHDHTVPGHLHFLGIAEFLRIASLYKLTLCNQYCTVNLGFFAYLKFS